ncbi:MAG TPA: GNAT family N-acetyltransferase [Pseudonocardia sp.]|jgi:GNAT superfamily N-acetyltransferase|nr:GNAT family N-acetyltransferase [Pseudonocardia sp.]
MAGVSAPAIEPVRADDRAAMDGWFGLLQVSHVHDAPELPPPCPVGHAARFSWPGFEPRAWVVREGHEVVAVAHLTLPQRENLTSAFADVLVAPAHRRLGLGSRLLDHVATDARTAGRTRLVLWTDRSPDGPDLGDGFLESVGARRGLAEMRRRLDLPVDRRRTSDLAASALESAQGYGLVQWTGPTPLEHLDDLAVLIGRMSTDAPMGDLVLDPQRWDAERVRERDAVAVRNGLRSVVTAAQAPDARLVAYTAASTCVVADGFASQGDTLVAPAHRGHRLGLWIKLANLELLLREHPEVRAIDTFNADDNRWMVAINEQLGFRPLRRQTDWELNL